MTKAAATQNDSEQMALTAPTSSALALPLEDFLNDAGSGLEEVSGEDMAVPYVSIVQKQSKVMDVEGFAGKPGMFMHTITRELFDGQQGIEVIPCHFRRFWREITDDLKNPKFIAEHSANWPVARGAEFHSDMRRHVCHDGTHANQIMRFYCLMVAPCDIPQPVCLTFKGSQIRKAKNWNSMLSVMTTEVVVDGVARKIQAPTFMSIWKLSTVMETGDENTWHGYELTSKGMLDPVGNDFDAEIYMQARDFHGMVAEGNVVEAGEDE